VQSKPDSAKLEKMNKSKGRRNFIRKASLGGAMALGFSQIISEAYASGKPSKISLQKDDVILFQGDSITDSGRNRDDHNANSTRGLGGGYAFLATANLLHDHADKTLKIYNRGISGNKVYQLAERWDADCLELKPTVLSILIGVNDFWHMMQGKYDGTIEIYRNDLKALLERTKENLPDVKLIIGEPFAVPDVKAVDGNWFPRFKEYQNAAREMAREFNAAFIPYQSIFEKASKVAPAVYWTHDGVHPSLAGSQLMAEAVLNNFGN
jgi:lysophospholipase L1-like esterase